MYYSKEKFLLSLTACILIASLFCASVYAEPTSGELKQKTSDLQGELDSMNSELSSLGKELETISDNIEETAASMEETQRRLDDAQQKGRAQYEAMKLRIKYMYEAGELSFLELLCTSENMPDFLNKAEFVKNVSLYDRNMMQSLLDIQEEIQKEGDALEEKQASLYEMQEELSGKRSELESRISSTSGELSKYKDLLAKVEEAERLAAEKAMNEARARALAEENAKNAVPAVSTGNPGSEGNAADVPGADIPSGASSGGGQSLGTFRITHYCPCFYCCGKWADGITASGTTARAGSTIAVDPKVIPLGSRVTINGHTYIAEDTGGAIKGNRIDVYVNDHSTALAYGVYYAEVFLQ